MTSPLTTARDAVIQAARVETVTAALEPKCRAFGQGDMPRAVAREFATAALAALDALPAKAAHPLDPYAWPPSPERWDLTLQQLHQHLTLFSGLIAHFGLLDTWKDGNPPLSPARMLEIVVERTRGDELWQPIETAPVGKAVLLYCPERGITNNERIELGMADNGRGSHHGWATAWMPLPSFPTENAHLAQGNRDV